MTADLHVPPGAGAIGRLYIDGNLRLVRPHRMSRTRLVCIRCKGFP